MAIVAFWGSPSECLPRELAGITLSDKKDKEGILIESSSGEDSNPIQTHVIKSKNTLLRTLSLADTYDSNDKLNRDILIGLHYYWNIAMGEVIKLRTRLVALRSK